MEQCIKIYSKTGEAHTFDLLKYPLEKVGTSIDTPAIFYYSFFDSIKHKISFEDAVDWNHLKTTNSAFIYENWFEPQHGGKLANSILLVINTYQIDPTKIFIILADELQVSELQKNLILLNIKGVNVDYYTKLLKDTLVPRNFNSAQDVKFSVMSRRYLKDRLLFFCELVNSGLLPNFSYSFHNRNPYTSEIYPVEHLKSSVPDTVLTEEVQKWMAGVPYLLENPKHWGNSFTDDIYTTLLRSKMHVVIETMYHETIYSLKQSEIAPWITEKTYKAIACKKLFLCYGQPRTLQALKTLGFKTFGDYINEEYDTLLDPVERRKALVSEIKRLSDLTKEEMDLLLNSTQDIVEHNFEVLCKKQQKKWNKDFENLGVFNESVSSYW